MSAQAPLVFIIYAREDEQFRAELKAQLLPMERSGVLRVWTDRELIAGEHWEPTIKKNLKNADVILLLVSSDYFQSDYIHEVELREALERHERGEACVVPVIVRPCVWDTDPVLKRTQVLPTDGVPVSDTRHWHTREAAWVDVVQGVRRTLQQLQQERAAAEAARRTAEEAETTRRTAEEQRNRDAEAARQREQQARAEAEARERAAREAEAARRAADHAAWQQAEQTNTPDAYRAYLTAHPTGDYTREARSRIKQSRDGGLSPTLRAAAIAGGGLALTALTIFLWPDRTTASAETDPAGQATAEAADWAAAQRANTIPAYRDFLEKHPNGPHDAAAEKARKALEQKFDALLSEALTLLRDGMHTNAYNQLDTALRLWPDHAATRDARNLIGDELYDSAIQTLERAVRAGRE